MQNTFLSVTEHVRHKFNAVDIVTEPFPTINIDNVFPDEFYQQILKHTIPTDCLQTLGELGRVPKNSYKDRKLVVLEPKMLILSNELRQFWEPFSIWMYTDFLRIVLEKFSKLIYQRFNNVVPKIIPETLYIRDTGGYKLGPHTDSLEKVITLLIYLPNDDSSSEFGTSIYQHKDASFRCTGGPHYEPENFYRISTVNFVPNRLFGFFKTNNSFHGVEEIPAGVERNLLIYDLKVGAE